MLENLYICCFDKQLKCSNLHCSCIVVVFVLGGGGVSGICDCTFLKKNKQQCWGMLS